MSLAAGEGGKKIKYTTTTKTRTHNRSVLLSFNSALISITAARRRLRSPAPRAATVYPSCLRYLQTPFQVFTLNLDQTQFQCLPHNLSYFKPPGMYICSCCKWFFFFFFYLLTDTLYLKKKKCNERQKTAPRCRPGKTKKKNVICWRCEKGAGVAGRGIKPEEAE